MKKVNWLVHTWKDPYMGWGVNEILLVVKAKTEEDAVKKMLKELPDIPKSEYWMHVNIIEISKKKLKETRRKTKKRIERETKLYNSLNGL
jgi:hypothetical protein